MTMLLADRAAASGSVGADRGVPGFAVRLEAPFAVAIARIVAARRRGAPVRLW